MSEKVMIAEGLRYDGRQEMAGKVLLYFTELDEAAPSYGATFVLTEEEVLKSSSAIMIRRAFKHAQFSESRKGAA